MLWFGKIPGTYSCDILCTLIVGPCCLVTMVLLITPATIPSMDMGERRERVQLSESGLMQNLDISTWKTNKQTKQINKQTNITNKQTNKTNKQNK